MILEKPKKVVFVKKPKAIKPPTPPQLPKRIDYLTAQRMKRKVTHSKEIKRDSNKHSDE